MAQLARTVFSSQSELWLRRGRMLDVRRVFFVWALCKYSVGSYYGDNISEDVSCQCVPSRLCSDEAGNGLLDIRFEDDLCPNHFDVCCENPIQDPRPPEPEKGCGFANSIGPRITSDSDVTQFGEFPWIVLIFDDSKEKTALCGGSLIHPEVVVTAAHCVASSDNSSLKVRAGEWNIRSTNEPLPHQDRSVKEIAPHPNYRPGTLWNDLALVFLSRPFEEGANVGFVCLPSKKVKVNEEMCVASGWGKNAFRRGRHASVLRKVTLPMVSRGKCQTALRSTRLGKVFRLHRSFVCAGGERNKDTCKGDGGSPLICPLLEDEGRFVQMGVVSWGIGCGASKTPGVYVNLPLFSDWIDRQLKARNLSDNYYKL